MWRGFRIGGLGVWVALLAARPALAAVAIGGGERDGAARRLVTVVRPPDADAASREITTRIIAELMAEGVPVMALTCAPDDDACAAVSEGQAVATVLVQGHGASRTVEVRAEIGPDANVVHRLAAEVSGRGPAALAVRTVELLRAMWLDGGATSMRPTSSFSPSSSSSQSSSTGGMRRASLGEPAIASPSPSPSPPAAPVGAGVAQDSEAATTPARAAPTSIAAEPVAAATARPARPLNLIATVGAAMIGSFSGLNNGFGPTVRVGRPTSDDRFMLSLFVLGPAFGKDQQNPAGSIGVTQGLVTLELDARAAPGGLVTLRAGVGSGLYVVRVGGQPVLRPMGGDTFFRPIGKSDSAVSIAFSGSAGLVARLHPDVGVFLDARLFFISPTPVVLLGGDEVGRAGNPGIVLASGIEVKL